MPWWGWLLVGIGVLIVGFIVFVVIFGRRMQRKQAEAEQQMELTKQTVSMLIIDKQKKKMKILYYPKFPYVSKFLLSMKFYQN